MWEGGLASPWLMLLATPVISACPTWVWKVNAGWRPPAFSWSAPVDWVVLPRCCLAAAGIGRIGLIDDDAVDLSNLQRQILHTTADVGAPKVASARAKLNALDPNVKVEVFRQRLNPNNAMEMLKGWDLVVDGTDNLPTRYLIDDACTFA